MPTEQPATPDPQRQHLAELERTNRALRLISAVNHALIHTTVEIDLIRQVCNIAVEVGQYRLAWVGFAEHDLSRTVRPVCHAGEENGYLQALHFSWADTEENCDPTGTAIRTRQPAVHADIAALPSCVPWREAALAREFRATIALPLHIDGRVSGALTLHSAVPLAFSVEEVQLLTELAADLSFGISAIRTRERQRQAEEKVWQSERRLHAIIDAAPYGAYEYELHSDGRLEFAGYNPAADRIIGLDHARFLGRSIEEAFPALASTPIPEAFRRVARTGERYEEEQVSYRDEEISGAYEISAFQTAPFRMAVFFRDITERRRAEQALRDSEEKFAKAFYTSPDAININRLADGVFLDVNQGFTDLTGFARDEVLGKSSLAGDIDIWVHPEDRQRLMMALRECGEMRGLEAEFRRKTGAIGSGLMSARIIELHGEPCILSITRDITERKQAAEQLRASEEKYRFLFETMAQGVVLQDAESRIIEANPAAATILGLSMEQLLGKTTTDPQWQLVHEDYSPLTPDEMPSNIALRTGQSVAGVTGGVYLPASRDFHWLIIHSVPKYQPGAVTPDLTMTTFTDITERKRVEDALRASEERLSLAIENSPDLIFILNSELRYIWAPKVVLGIPKEEVLGTTDHDLFPPAEARRLDEINRRVMRTGERVRYEKNIVREDTTLSYENTALPWRDAQGQIVGVVVYSHDITERKEMDRAKDQFLSVLSHELKTPLTSIIGWSQIAQKKPDLAPQALDTVLRNAREQQVLLERLLILSDILTGKLVLNREPLDLWQITLRAEQRLRQAAEERGITITLQPPAKCLCLEIDGTFVEQAIYEVIDNAINCTPAGGSITIQGCREEKVHLLTVRDSGQGIEPQQLSTLVKPFTQLQRREEIGGLGIGLALVRGITEAHGGGITLTSPGPGQGTTVTLCLPHQECIPCS